MQKVHKFPIEDGACMGKKLRTSKVKRLGIRTTVTWGDGSFKPFTYTDWYFTERDRQQALKQLEVNSFNTKPWRGSIERTIELIEK